MFRHLEITIISIQMLAMALILLSCVGAAIGAALICTLMTRRTDDRPRVLKGQASQGGQSTGRLERSDQAQG